MSPADRRLLQFEDAHPKMTGRKMAGIRNELGMNTTRYLQRLFELVDTVDAEQTHPVLVHRVRRVRDAATERRVARVF